MNTRFSLVNYLQHLKIDYDEKDSAEEKSEAKQDHSDENHFAHPLERGWQKVSDALSQRSIEKLSQVFNGFPLNIKPLDLDAEPHPESKPGDNIHILSKPLPFDNTSMGNLVAAYNDLIRGGKKNPVDRKVTLISNSYYDKAEIKNFLKDLMVVAADEMLFGANTLRPEIIDSLKMNVIFEQNNASQRKKVISRLMASYISKILLVAVQELWRREYPEAPPQLDVLHQAMYDYIVGTLIRSYPFTTQLASVALFGRPLAVNCGMIIAELQSAKLTALITEDFRRLSAAQEELVPVFLKKDWVKAKLLFWQDVKEAAKTYLAQQCALEISQTELQRDREKDSKANDNKMKVYVNADAGIKSSYTKRLEELLKTIEDALPQPVPKAGMFSFFNSTPKLPDLQPLQNPALASEQALQTLFTVRDNNIAIQSFLYEVIALQIDINRREIFPKFADFVAEKRHLLLLTPASAVYLKKIEAMRFGHFIHILPSGIFSELARNSPPGTPLYGLLTKYELFFRSYFHGSHQKPEPANHPVDAPSMGLKA
jgi:hypothetical protein